MYIRSFVAAVGAVLVTASVVAGQVTVFSETFDDDQGSFTFDNGANPLLGWFFDDTCPQAHGGASGAGTLRWGHEVLCANYGDEAHGATARTPLMEPAIGTPPGKELECRLSFHYLMDLEEIGTLDNASVSICDDVSCETIMRTVDGDFINDGNWHIAQPTADIGFPFAIEFSASTMDGTNNDGLGWSVDDVSVRCRAVPIGTPAVGTTGAVVLLVAMSAALVTALLIRRRRVGGA